MRPRGGKRWRLSLDVELGRAGEVELLGLVVALPTLRTKGLQVALVTLVSSRVCGPHGK